ncbi:MAG: flippase, partial [Candidatus Diapherotrites archaeon]|nr:flippase [Candidatus Diapherotrites archaeon]
MAKGSIIAFIGIVFSRLSAFLLKLFLARNLTISEFGLFYLAMAIINSVLLFGIGGFPQGLLRFISFYSGKRDLNSLKGTFVGGMKIIILLSVIFLITIVMFSKWLSQNIFDMPSLAPVLIILALSLPLNGTFLAIMETFTALKKLKFVTYFDGILLRSLQIIFVIVFVYLGFGIIGVAISVLLSFIFVLIISIVALKREAPYLFERKIKPQFHTKEYIYYSLPLFMATSLVAISERLDIFMIGLFRNNTDVALYTIALSITAFIPIFLVSLGKIFAPHASELFAKGDLEGLNTLYKSITRWLVIIILPLSSLLFWFSKDVLIFLFGTPYANASSALRILIVGYSLPSLMGGVNTLLLMSGRSKLTLLNNFLGLISNFVLNLLLIPMWGIAGAAIATSFSMVFVNLLGLFQLKRFFNLNPFS